jgi:hypothetical protein
MERDAVRLPQAPAFSYGCGGSDGRLAMGTLLLPLHNDDDHDHNIEQEDRNQE